MSERVQKLIAAAGLCSRRAAEELLRAGRVSVNGTVAALGAVAEPEDEIRVDGKPLSAPTQTTTVLLYKPRGVVTTLRDERGRPTVAGLLPPELGRLYPVGRLDQFSEGLLLMTNDGELANRLTHPAGEICKTYHLWVSGWQEGALDLLRRPIVLDGYRIKPPAVRLLWQREHIAKLEIAIQEGRNRQIRRMAEAAGLTTTRLKRVAEGKLSLGDLKPGEWRLLTKDELEQMRVED